MFATAISIDSWMTKARFPTQILGPVLALDLGQKRVGAAVSDELLITIQRLTALKRSSWKRLLVDVQSLVNRFDAQTLVIGLPLRLDGTSGEAAQDASRLASNFAKSLNLPVYVQDERLTTFDAHQSLLSQGLNSDQIGEFLDSEAAALILRDFLQDTSTKCRVRNS